MVYSKQKMCKLRILKHSLTKAVFPNFEIKIFFSEPSIFLKLVLDQKNSELDGTYVILPNDHIMPSI